MPENMAVRIPGARIVGVECDRDACFWRHKDCVAQSTIQWFAVDLDHLKRVPMQVHRVRHAGLIDKLERDSLTLLDLDLGLLAAWFCEIENDPVDRPLV